MTDERARNYTNTEAARSLHATFVANVFKRLAAMGRLHGGAQLSGEGTPLALGRPMYDWLSAESGIPRRTLENLLNLHNQPTMVGAAAIAKALGVGLDTLLGQPTFGMSEPQAVIINDVERGATSSPALECFHAKPGGARVCETCLAKWRAYQQRLRALYETSRAQHRDGWDAENTTTCAAQLAAANLPKDTDER